MSVSLWICVRECSCLSGPEEDVGYLGARVPGCQELNFQALQKSSKGSTMSISPGLQSVWEVWSLTLHQSHHFVILFQTCDLCLQMNVTGTFVDMKHSGSFHVFNYRDEERFLHQTWEWTTGRTSSSPVHTSTWPSLDKQIHLYLSTKLADFEKPHIFTAQTLDGFLSIIPTMMTLWVVVRLSNLSS